LTWKVSISQSPHSASLIAHTRLILSFLSLEGHFSRKKNIPKRVGGFDLICENGCEVSPNCDGYENSDLGSSLPTMLGTHNDRVDSLKKLRKWCREDD